MIDGILHPQAFLLANVIVHFDIKKVNGDLNTDLSITGGILHEYWSRERYLTRIVDFKRDDLNLAFASTEMRRAVKQVLGDVIIAFERSAIKSAKPLAGGTSYKLCYWKPIRMALEVGGLHRRS
jgi:hypothetical protein